MAEPPSVRPAAQTFAPVDGLRATDVLAVTYDVALLDLDGVVYSGDEGIPGAAEALAEAERRGMRRVFVTNNASRPPARVARHLTALGIPATATDVVTSAQAAAGLLAERLPAGARVLVVGGDGLVEALTERGLQAVSSAEDDPAAVVQGFSPLTTWQMLMEACVGVRAGLPWVVTNADATLPTPRGEGPGNGALVNVVRGVTGTDPDEVAGKPHAPIMLEARRRRQAERPLVVGDRLDTDIEAAVSAGIDSLLVLTGVTGVHALLTCPPHQRPTYVGADLTSLLRPGHAPEYQDGWWQCGDVAVRVGGPGASPLEVVDSRDHRGRRPDPSAVDATFAANVLHATASALWGQSGEPDALPAVRDALRSWAAPFGWDR